MRRLTVGRDAEGRSCLVESVELEPTLVGSRADVKVARLHAAGAVRWLVVERPPPGDSSSWPDPVGHPDTLDLVIVHEGSGTLVLEGGSHHVEAGDCLVLPGVAHAMQPGPDGCRVSVVSVEAPSRPDRDERDG